MVLHVIYHRRQDEGTFIYKNALMVACAHVNPRGLLLVRTRHQNLQTPKWLYGTMGFLGTQDFFLRILRQGEIFLPQLCIFKTISASWGSF